MNDIIEQLKEEAPAERGKMKTAFVMFGLHKDHSVGLSNVTPAELQLLIVMHAVNNGRCPVYSITLTNEVSREIRDELTRLRIEYGNAKVKALFGPNSSMPATFREAIETGMAWSMEGPALGNSPLVGRNLTAEESSAFV